MRRFRRVRKFHFILDNDPSHVNGEVDKFAKEEENVRFVYTPYHASWLNQAEIALNILWSKYIKRGSYVSFEDMKDKIRRSVPEYNSRAHPFNWSFTRHKMREWLEGNCCQTCPT
jgi:transposase